MKDYYLLLVSGDSLVLDVITDHSEDVYVGQTLKRPLLRRPLGEEKKQSRESLEHERPQAYLTKDVFDQSNLLSLSLG